MLMARGGKESDCMGESGGEDSKKRMASPWWAMEEKTTCGDIFQTVPTTHVPSPSYNFSNYLPGKDFSPTMSLASISVGPIVYTPTMITSYINQTSITSCLLDR
jgi:hypothetical protein